MLKPWWERFPGRLEYELKRLKEIGITCDPVFAGNAVSLKFLYEHNGEEISLVVRFPASYPYLRFTVEAPSLEMEHHLNPFTKDLCILGRATANWEVTDTVAETLTAQMPKVIKAGRSSELAEVQDLEEDQPEPVSVYFETKGQIYIESRFVIGSMHDGLWGKLKMGMSDENTFAVLESKSVEGNLIASANPYVAKRFGIPISARWVRLSNLPLINHPEKLLAHLTKIHPGLGSPQWQKPPRIPHSIDLLAVTFTEETAQRRNGEGWLFIVRRKR